MQNPFCETVEIMGRNYIDLGTATIDGDSFILTIPTVEAWKEFVLTIKSDSVKYPKWLNLGKTDGVKWVFCQENSTKGDLIVCKLSIDARLVNSAFPTYVNIYDSAVCDAFVPFLVPLDANHVPEFLTHEDLHTWSYGGSFYVNNLPLKCHSLSLFDNMVTGDYTNDRFVIGNTHNLYDAYLPWLRVANGYMCGIPLIYDTNFAQIIRLFNPEVEI